MRRLASPFVVLALAVLLAAPASARADTVRFGDIEIERAWARPSIGRSPNGAAYLTIANHGEEADRLVAASTPAAERTELHTHLVEGGIMRMRPIEAVEVPPGAPAAMRPGGDHVMLMGLRQPLRVGDSFELILVFEKAGEVAVTVRVESPAGAPGGPAGGHGGHGKGHGS